MCLELKFLFRLMFGTPDTRRLRQGSDIDLHLCCNEPKRYVIANTFQTMSINVDSIPKRA